MPSTMASDEGSGTATGLSGALRTVPESSWKSPVPAAEDAAVDGGIGEADVIVQRQDGPVQRTGAGVDRPADVSVVPEEVVEHVVGSDPTGQRDRSREVVGIAAGDVDYDILVGGAVDGQGGGEQAGAGRDLENAISITVLKTTARVDRRRRPNGDGRRVADWCRYRRCSTGW